MTKKDETKNYALMFAPLWKRILSYIIDSIILFLIFYILIIIAYGNDFRNFYLQEKLDLQITLVREFIEKNSFKLSLANFIISAAYFVLQWINNGQTIGSKILKIAVISRKFRKLNIIESLIRYTTISLCSIAFYIPLLFVIDPIFKQRIQDVLSDSVVVELPIKYHDNIEKNEELQEEDDESDENYSDDDDIYY